MSNQEMSDRDRVTAFAEAHGWETVTEDPLRSEWRKADMYVFVGWDPTGLVTVARTERHRVYGRGRAEKLIEELSR